MFRLAALARPYPRCISVAARCRHLGTVPPTGTPDEPVTVSETNTASPSGTLGRRRGRNKRRAAAMENVSQGSSSHSADFEDVLERLNQEADIVSSPYPDLRKAPFLRPHRSSSTGLPLDPANLPLEINLDHVEDEISEELYSSTLVHGRSLYLPVVHPRTHSIPVANIHFRSYDPRLLEFFTHFVSHAASALGIPISRVTSLPTARTLWTVPRSPFAHKKSQENFERRVHKRAIKAWDADMEVVDHWFQYVGKHAMAGVGMKMTKWERMPLSLGLHNPALMGKRKPEPLAVSSTAQQIADLGAKIMKDEMGTFLQSQQIRPEPVQP